MIPESPRWLLVMGKHKKAEKIIRKIAAINGRKLPDDFSVSQLDVVRDSVL